MNTQENRPHGSSGADTGNSHHNNVIEGDLYATA